LILNLSIPSDVSKAETYLSKLIADGSKIELKKIPSRRTLSQNSYVHKLFALAGTHFGYTGDEMKIVVKRILGYVYIKDGQEFYSHTSDMDTKELTTFIDRFRNWSASEGCYLPSSDEMGENWDYYAKEIERAEVMQKRYGV